MDGFGSMTPRQQRFALIALGLVAVALATLLVLNAFRSNLVFFFTPTQVVNGEVPKGRNFRIGGLVQQGSLSRGDDGFVVHFVVTDRVKSVPVMYKGILPDLFKEGKGAVVQGQLRDDGIFRATEVLAKHDENYMPPEAASALTQAGAGHSNHVSSSSSNPGKSSP